MLVCYSRFFCVFFVYFGVIFLNSHLPAAEEDALARFLVADKKVLRFYALWESRDRASADLRSFVVHFFLVDDTVEVRRAPLAAGKGLLNHGCNLRLCQSL